MDFIFLFSRLKFGRRPVCYILVFRTLKNKKIKLKFGGYLYFIFLFKILAEYLYYFIFLVLKLANTCILYFYFKV